MSFGSLFSKRKERELRYHAAAKVLINGCCSIPESEELSKHLSLTENAFREFHRHKRHLALRTVLLTAAITLDPTKRNLFVTIFQYDIASHDNLKAMPKDVREMYEEVNSAFDGAYLSVFQDVTNNLDTTNKEPVDSLMENLSNLFATLLQQEGSHQYIEIGKKIFQKYHRISTLLLRACP
jgi:hypothetical protein